MIPNLIALQKKTSEEITDLFIFTLLDILQIKMSVPLLEIRFTNILLGKFL
jgi:hypothetical protein